MATVTKHQIDGYPVWVITNAYNRTNCKKWIHYYSMQSSFQIATVEAPGLKHQYIFKEGMSLATYNSIFDANKWLPDWNSENGDCHTEEHRHRTHVNLVLKENQFSGHADVSTGAEPGLVTLWFANPGWQSEWGGGFWLGKDRELYVPNTWNTLIMFPHQLHHETEAVSDPDALRLTVYSGYCLAWHQKFPGTLQIDDTTTRGNYWSRHPVQSHSIKKKIRREYSINYTDNLNYRRLDPE